MRFGLFGGATVKTGSSDANAVGDSSSDYTEFVDYVCEAESLGFHSVFLVEHHFTGFNQVSASLNMLSYLAAKTKRLRLGTAVTVLPWHNPVLVAEQAATVDVLSGGRLDFGIGRGYRASEFRGFCIDPAEAQERYDEALEVIRKAWAHPTGFTHHGKRWNFDQAIVEPTPVQKPHPPLWIGAGTAPVLETAGRLGLNMLLDQLAAPEVLGERVAIYKRAVEATGRIYDPMRLAVTRTLCLAMNETEREQRLAERAQFLEQVRRLTQAPGQTSTLAMANTPAEARKASEAAALLGDPEEIIARLKHLQSMGIEYVLLMDLTASRTALRTFAREVMPAFSTVAA
jgi:alkanesulfonate monooxygenase SsuD/methylene tetrahydromethanopterin reductase-like flavin-dependent oxidoreductase (luciferase family)